MYFQVALNTSMHNKHDWRSIYFKNLLVNPCIHPPEFWMHKNIKRPSLVFLECVFFSWYNTEVFVSLLYLSMHYIWEKQFRASVINFLRLGLLETSKTFYMEFLIWGTWNTLDFSSLGAILQIRRAKVKKHWILKRASEYRLREILLYEVPPFHCLILRAYSLLGKIHNLAK